MRNPSAQKDFGDVMMNDVVAQLKVWAKGHDVNDSKKRTFNSLSIILLAVFHLQVLLVLKHIYVVT